MPPQPPPPLHANLKHLKVKPDSGLLLRANPKRIKSGGEKANRVGPLVEASPLFSGTQACEVCAGGGGHKDDSSRSSSLFGWTTQRQARKHKKAQPPPSPPNKKTKKQTLNPFFFFFPGGRPAAISCSQRLSAARCMCKARRVQA